MLKNLFKTKKAIIFFTAIVAVLFFSRTVFAIFYSPGETLNPACMPTDVDCDVLIAAGHNPVSLGTANGLSLSTQVLSLALASTSTTGALSSADWNTFNNKQETLVSGTNIKTINSTSLLGSGDIVISGSDATKLPLAGGIMTGNILMTGNKVIGGSTTTSDLIFQTTTGIGTTGADMHFLVGNNGATTAMTILNNGSIGIGTSTPSAKLSVISDSSLQPESAVNILTVIGGNRFTGGQSQGITLTAGTAAAMGGAGGTVSITAGNGGSAGGSTSTGGNLTFTAGNGIAGGAPGVVTINPGTGTGLQKVLLATAGGNVGIGATTPAIKLDVAGGGRFTGSAISLLSGSINPTASTTVTGVGTLFTTELVVGDRIRVTGETRTVIAIASDTSLTVDTAFSDNANDTSPDKLGTIFVARDSSNAEKVVINDLGSIGIGTATPTAVLHLKAGTATANTAPLKLTAGTNLAATEAGAIEYDGTHLYFTATNAGTRFQLDQQAGSQTPWTSTINAAGFTLNGNSTASGNLTLDSTSDATKGFVLLNPTGGNVGIGQAIPTAVLHLKAGTATAGTAPLKLTAGTNLTATEAGAIEYDGTHLYFTAANAGTRYQLDQQAAGASIGGAVTGGTAGSVLFLDTAGILAQDNANFFWDNTNMRLGIGTAAPAGLLHVSSDTAALGQTYLTQANASADSFDLNFRKARGTGASPTIITSGDELGVINFTGYGGAAGYITGAAIKGISSNTIADNRVPGYLSFWTGTNTQPSVLTERMRILSVAVSTANVQVGTGSTSLFTQLSMIDYKSSGTAIPGIAFSGPSSFTALGQANITGNSLRVGTVSTTNVAWGAMGATAFSFIVDGKLGIGTTTPTANLQIDGNLSAASWTTDGIAFDSNAATFTDTSTAAAGTVTVRTGNSFGAPTFASTNAITVSDAFTLYVPKPIAGTNTTITRANSAYFEGNVGIGLLSPTAALHLKAGTATANTAPLKLTAGTNLTVTEAGAIEYDGTHLYFTATNAGTRFQLDQQSGGSQTPWTSDINAAGFKLIGDTTTTGDLTLQTTSGIGTTGADIHFLVGNNGATEAMTILNSSFVGIGTTTPGSKLTVSNTSGQLTLLDSNSTDTALTGGTLMSLNSGLFTMQGINSTGSGSAIVFAIDQVNSRVGINDTAPSRVLDVKGNVCLDLNSDEACTDTTSAISDARLKNNISDLQNGLDLISQLRPVRFTWNGQYNTGTGNSLGFLAQDVETIFPELVITDTAGYKNLDYGKLTAVLAKGIQELNLNLEGITGTITPLDGSDNESFVTAFFNNVYEKITIWLADVGNGIGSVFANVFNAKEKICVDGECLTKDDIQALLLLAYPEGTTQTPDPIPDADTTDTTDTTDTPDDSDSTPTPEESTPDPSPTPEPSPEEIPESESQSEPEADQPSEENSEFETEPEVASAPEPTPNPDPAP